MRPALAILLAVSALAPAFAPAQVRDPPEPTRPAEGSDPEPENGAGDTGELDPETEAAQRAAEAALERELREDVSPPSIALGPVMRGRPTLSLEVGWLRSGLRFDLGVGGKLDFVARLDAMLLYDGLSGQDGMAAGLRYTPITAGPLRLSAEATAGQVFAPTEGENGRITAFRGELSAGYGWRFATAYVRGALRVLRASALLDTTWERDQELGAGLEARFRRVVVGAEGYRLSRPGLDGLSQWRLRVGIAL